MYFCVYDRKLISISTFILCSFDSKRIKIISLFKYKLV